MEVLSWVTIDSVFSETMLRVKQDVLLTKMFGHVTKNNVLEDLAV